MMKSDGLGEANNDDSGSEVGEDEILQQVAAGGLPVSTETLIALNTTYQETLALIIQKVDEKLAVGQTKLESLKAEREQAMEEYKCKSWVRVPVLQYVPPYFRDSMGMPPDMNMETRFKQEQRDLDPLVEPAKNWSKREKENLLYALRGAATEIKLAPLTQELEKLEEDFKKGGQGVHAGLKKKIDQVKKKIDRIKSKVDISKLPAGFFETVDWHKISAVDMHETRKPLECRLIFFNEMHPSLNQERQWGEGELKRLDKIAKKNEYKNWKDVATELGTGRTAFQCFEKYQTALNPEIKKEWTKAEDEQLSEAVKSCRNGEYIPWEQVAGMMEGRTRGQCQTRWTRKLDPTLKSGRWDEKEDVILTAAVQKYGLRGWRKIAVEVPGRTEAQCRERWASALRGDIKKGPWSPEEDQILMSAMKKGRKIDWPKIYATLPGRTSAACKIRHRSLMKTKAVSKKKNGGGKIKKENGARKKRCSRCRSRKMKSETEDEEDEESESEDDDEDNEKEDTKAKK